MKLKRVLFLILGCISLGFGCIGCVLPILPTVPFFLATVFCFANSSQKLHDWFVSTKLYKNNLESFVKGQGMTWCAKIRIMITVTLLMSVGFFVMFGRELYVPCMVLGFVWLFHIVYFTFGVKKYKKTKDEEF